jgi:hypothetical protein
MADVHAEVACHTPLAGMYAVRLYGGPWDGKEVGVRDPDPPFVRVNGPRHGRHSVWITHLYERRVGRYEFVRTEVVPLSASSCRRANAMAEADWASGCDPQPMLSFLQASGRLSERKARLFAAACCRRIWHLLVDERLRQAVEVAEAHAEGNAGEGAMAAARDGGLAVWRAAYEHMTGHRPPEVVSRTVPDRPSRTGVTAWLSGHPTEEALAEAPSPRAAVTSAAEAVLRASSPVRLLPWTAWEPAAEAAAGGWHRTGRCPAGPTAQRAERAACGPSTPS